MRKSTGKKDRRGSGATRSLTLPEGICSLRYDILGWILRIDNEHQRTMKVRDRLPCPSSDGADSFYISRIRRARLCRNASEGNAKHQEGNNNPSTLCGDWQRRHQAGNKLRVINISSYPVGRRHSQPASHVDGKGRNAARQPNAVANLSSRYACKNGGQRETRTIYTTTVTESFRSSSM